ncbi:IS30 family transposase [Nocardia amikacinitolerans]|uniref:IS30 family transposase n=6 Tax=Nocardia amikacinitolerans TaxID=756689 RepID=UPI00082ED471
MVQQGPVRSLRSVRRAFWDLVGAGVGVGKAGVWVGVSETTGLRWFAETGGVKPKFDEPKAGPRRRLSFAEREEIAVGVAAGESINAIARRLGRWPSTIMREIAKNGPAGRGAGPKARYRRKHRFGARRSGSSAVVVYRASLAQARYEQRICRPKTGKLADNQRLKQKVQDWLDEGYSPAQVAHRLPVEFPDAPEMRVSHETIYQSIYVQGRGGLRREIHTQLRTGRAVRRPRRRAGQRLARIPDMITISQRPPEIADRAVPGHWEGDLIIGKDGASAIGTLVERMTRFVLLLHLPYDHSALAVQEAMITKMAALPAILRRTLTWDQGIEMRNHAQIAAATDLDIYFCDPHSPWQRGTNENTNGLLRQYFPKGTDLSVFPADYLDFIATRLNNRPRKTLNWKKPAEALDELLSNPSNPPGVALTA